MSSFLNELLALLAKHGMHAAGGKGHLTFPNFPSNLVPKPGNPSNTLGEPDPVCGAVSTWDFAEFKARCAALPAEFSRYNAQFWKEAEAAGLTVNGEATDQAGNVGEFFALTGDAATAVNYATSNVRFINAGLGTLRPGLDAAHNQVPGTVSWQATTVKLGDDSILHAWIAAFQHNLNVGDDGTSTGTGVMG